MSLYNPFNSRNDTIIQKLTTLINIVCELDPNEIDIIFEIEDKIDEAIEFYKNNK